MLQVQGNVPDKRLDESLLQPEPFLSLIKCFIFNLEKKHNTDRCWRRSLKFFNQNTDNFPLTLM